MTEQHDCAESVFHRLGYSGSWDECSRKGKIERDGKWWCRQHDPKRRARERDERTERDNAYWAGEKNRIYRHRVEEEACKGLSTEWLEQGGLQRLVEEAKATIKGERGIQWPETSSWINELEEALP